MNVVEPADAAEFLERAHDFLVGDEARNNLVLGLAGTIVADPGFYEVKQFWIVEHEGAVVGAAMRTPPYNLLLADTHDAAAISALVDHLRGEELPGVGGLLPAVDQFARAWSEGEPQVAMRQGVFALEHIVDLPRPPGASRPALPDDRELLIDWWRAFVAEAVPGGPAGESPARMVDARLDGNGRGVWVWEVDGSAVSLAGWGGQTPNGIRIGPVYTPPGLRGNGYATALTADLSRRLLDEGRRFCFLYTDLANPTSNAIYERIGYVRVAESCTVTF
jgi:uncharacterized protein